jgi:uncharacterized protein (TIGR00369 family)
MREWNGMHQSSEIKAIIQRVQRIPMVATLKMKFEDFGQGTCRVKVPYDACYEGVFESLHGGILMTIADSVACFAILTLTSADQRLTTTDMNIRFLAPCFTDVTAEARVIRLGATMCPVAVDLHDENGKLVAVAQVNYIRLRKPKKA